MYHHFVLVIAVFVAGAPVSCSEYDVEQCLIPLTEFYQKLGISNGSAPLNKQDISDELGILNKVNKISQDLQSVPLYSLNDQQLYDYCKYGRQTAVCLDGLDILVSLSKFFEGFLDSVDFLCEVTMEEYKSHQQCYAKTTLQNGLEVCNNEAIAHSKSMLSDPFISMDKACGYMKEEFRCIRDAVESECGKDAADWQISYGKTLIKPMMDIINCADELFPQASNVKADPLDTINSDLHDNTNKGNSIVTGQFSGTGSIKDELFPQASNGKADPMETINSDLHDNTYKGNSMATGQFSGTAIPQWAIWTIITVSVTIVAVIIYVIVALACARSRKKTASKLPFKNVLFSPVATEAPPQYSDTVKEP